MKIRLDYGNIGRYLYREQRRLRAELKKPFHAGEPGESRNVFAERTEVAHMHMERNREIMRRGHMEACLAEVEHALEKWAAGTYGLCDMCGRSIPKERLEAIPYTNLCLECKNAGKRAS